MNIVKTVIRETIATKEKVQLTYEQFEEEIACQIFLSEEVIQDYEDYIIDCDRISLEEYYNYRFKAAIAAINSGFSVYIMGESYKFEAI